jgi:hypothetical protein
LKISKNLTGDMEELVKEPKLWGLGSLTNSFGVLRSTIRSENQPFHFLKIVGHGSIIPYLPVLSSKKREDRTLLCFWPKKKFKMAKIQGFKGCQSSNFLKIFENLPHSILSFGA